MYKNYAEIYRKNQLRSTDFLNKENSGFYLPPSVCQLKTESQTYNILENLQGKPNNYPTLYHLYNPKFLDK